MESIMNLKNMLPSTMIAGDLGSVTLKVSVKDIAEAIVKQIKQAGFEARYEVQGDVIVFTIVLSPQPLPQVGR